jgi:predicted acyl esterase
VLYASSTQRDTDFFVKLSEQYPQSAEERGKGVNPASQVVTKGWLRASHRALDEARSSEMEPYHTHSDPQPLKPGEVTRFDISVEPNAFRFRKGNRIRLEIANGDSPVTDVLWTHYYQPNKIGQDTLWHNARYPSQLILPVHE